MHVLIDARKIRDGGIGTYIRNLASGLLEQPGVELGMICRSSEDLPESLRDRVELHLDSTPCYSLRELFNFPKKRLTSRYDLFHVPHYTMPFGVDIPTVVTVHDLIHITHPERWYYPLVAGLILRSALKRAAAIVTVSQATARSVAEFSKQDRSVLAKLHVVPNAIAPELLMKPESGNGSTVRGPYLLSVCSTAKPHKGTRELLEAFSILKSSSSSDSATDVTLVIAGQGAKQSVSVGHHGASNDDVVFLGEVQQRELAGLYAGARALVVPSRAEGFCLPVLEAQAQHVPVVTTPIPAVEDLVTSQDTIASDFTPKALASAIAETLHRERDGDSPDVTEEYSRHLARFDRAALGGEVAGLYSRVLEAQP